MKDGAWGLATGPDLQPGHLLQDGRARRPGQGRGQARRPVRQPHPRRGRRTARRHRGGARRSAARPGCRVHISHIKASGQSAWGKAADAVALIETARKKGQAVTADQYPYIASSTSLRGDGRPDEVPRGHGQGVRRPARRPERRAADAKDSRAEGIDGRDGGKSIQIARYAPNPKWQGKNLDRHRRAGEEGADRRRAGDRARRRRRRSSTSA